MINIAQHCKAQVKYGKTKQMMNMDKLNNGWTCSKNVIWGEPWEWGKLVEPKGNGIMDEPM